MRERVRLVVVIGREAEPLVVVDRPVHVENAEYRVVSGERLQATANLKLFGPTTVEVVQTLVTNHDVLVRPEIDPVEVDCLLAARTRAARHVDALGVTITRRE